ncbi:MULTISPECIES: hypothetical protein [Sinorhizobium/Ensifer group]|uniref:hypothetical protein n=1 Tax=Sinorhizobium/Ensifer group TaxID=227292 RepID=UPI001115815B|nr:MULTISPECIES: hypothetical protein [Sinorhizobium/Ensifer group]
MKLNPIETLSNSDSSNPFHIVCPTLEFVLQKEESKSRATRNILASPRSTPGRVQRIAGEYGTRAQQVARSLCRSSNRCQCCGKIVSKESLQRKAIVSLLAAIPASFVGTILPIGGHHRHSGKRTP